MSRSLIVGLILIASITAVHAFGLGLGNRHGRLGVATKHGNVPIVGCVSPTAPNGVVDLSKCSNAFYAAVIF